MRSTGCSMLARFVASARRLWQRTESSEARLINDGMLDLNTRYNKVYMYYTRDVCMSSVCMQCHAEFTCEHVTSGAVSGALFEHRIYALALAFLAGGPAMARNSCPHKSHPHTKP